VTTPEHDVQARECIVITTPPIPAWLLVDRQCPACAEGRALIRLDPDFADEIAEYDKTRGWL
jgi:hypothetical protein